MKNTLAPERDIVMLKYELAIRARNFHYDNFSKWSTYFYVAIGAIFIGYCSVTTASYQDSNKECLQIGLLLLGYLSSILWHISNKGYYFWALNFIKIINFYEKKIFGDENNEKVYSILAYREDNIDVLYPHRASNFSTSKISLIFSYLIAFSWGIILFNKLLTLTSELNISCVSACYLLLNPLVIMILSIVGKHFLQSDINSFSYLED